MVFFQETEGLVVRAPEGEELDAVFLVGEDLALELGDMLLPPVVGDFFDAHLRHHLGPGLWRALRGVKRDDAPGGEVLFVEEIGGMNHGTHGKEQSEEKAGHGGDKNSAYEYNIDGSEVTEGSAIQRGLTEGLSIQDRFAAEPFIRQGGRSRLLRVAFATLPRVCWLGAAGGQRRPSFREMDSALPCAWVSAD